MTRPEMILAAARLPRLSPERVQQIFQDMHIQAQAAPAPLAGHHGDCAKVTTATVTGNNGVACTCGVEK